MKYYQLLSCADFLKKCSFINSIIRVDDNILQIKFENKLQIYADLQKSTSTFFMCDNFFISKTYHAPFDKALQKRFTKVKIKSLKVLENNRILEISVVSESGYKCVNSTLFLEFTGRNTNAIILDEDKKVVEALRHIDLKVSSRQVKVGELLNPLPKYEINEKIENITNIEEFLYSAYQKRQEINLENLKTQKMVLLQKKIDKIESILDSLENEEELLRQANLLQKKATLLLSNKYNLNDYDKKISLYDFDGNSCSFEIENEFRTLQNAIESYFQKSKKLKQKAKSQYKERESLEEKKEFLDRLGDLVKNAKSIQEVNILSPKQNNKNGKKLEQDPFLTLFFDDFKIMVGKNRKGNIALLKLAKKNDIWLHVKDIPSAHVIVKTNKMQIPQNVLEFSAKLCVNFSKLGTGNYTVDYTQRVYVKQAENANVTYTNYKSIEISKE